MDKTTEWVAFLQRERARKLGSLDMFARGVYMLLINQDDGRQTNISGELMEEHERSIAEIEAILTEAGQPLE